MKQNIAIAISVVALLSNAVPVFAQQDPAQAAQQLSLLYRRMTALENRVYDLNNQADCLGAAVHNMQTGGVNISC